jgi:hypothetical protein
MQECVDFILGTINVPRRVGRRRSR